MPVQDHDSTSLDKFFDDEEEVVSGEVIFPAGDDE